MAQHDVSTRTPPKCAVRAYEFPPVPDGRSAGWKFAAAACCAVGKHCSSVAQEYESMALL